MIRRHGHRKPGRLRPHAGTIVVDNMTQTHLPLVTRTIDMIAEFLETCDFLLSVAHCGRFAVASRNGQAHTVPACKSNNLILSN